MKVPPVLLNPIWITPEQSRQAADFVTGVGKGWVNAHLDGDPREPGPTPLGTLLGYLGVQRQMAVGAAEEAGMRNYPAVINGVLVGAALVGAGKGGVQGKAIEGIPAKIGEFAGESIPARSAARDFTVGERAEINVIGAKTGCHTCGKTEPGTKSGNFVPDHQPPSALNRAGDPQRLYPHCINCSREQGLGIARQLQRESK